HAEIRPRQPAEVPAVCAAARAARDAHRRTSAELGTRPVAKRRFGVSTRLYEDRRLQQEQLREIASFGFDAIEVHGVRTHLDFANEAVIADLQQWLAEARLDLLGLRVPAATSTDDVDSALFVARRIPFGALTLQVVRPREAAKRIDRLTDL